MMPSIYYLVLPIYSDVLGELQVIETALGSRVHKCLVSGESYNGWYLFRGPFVQVSQAVTIYQQYNPDQWPDIFDISGPMFDSSNASVAASPILDKVPLGLLFMGILVIALTHGKMKASG